MKIRIAIYVVLAGLVSIPGPVFGDGDGHYSTFSIGHRRNGMYLGNVNRSVYIYNYTRPWLTDKTDYFTGLKGWDLEVEERWDGMGLVLGLNGVSRTHHAEGPEPDNSGALGKRDIRVGLLGFTFGPTVYLLGTEHFEVKLGASVDMHWFSINTTYNEGSPENILNDFKMGSTFWVQANLYATRRLGVGIKGYYQVFYRSRVDIANMPYYFQGADYPYAMEDKINNYGVSLLLNISGRGRQDFY